MNTVSTDRIEKSVVLRAPRSRVWKALTEPDQFGQWFGVKLAGPFHPGAHVTGKVTHEGYEHIPFTFTIERMEPERLFSWRWHVLLDAERGLVSEPATLVVFELEDVEEGTLLKVAESGFDAIPPEYRETAFRGNEGGWAQQMESIKRFLAGAA
jgi:uncharacterized protein YndB with AHSA1/START domain